MNKERKISNCITRLRCIRNDLVQKFLNEASSDYMVKCSTQTSNIHLLRSICKYLENEDKYNNNAENDCKVNYSNV